MSVLSNTTCLEHHTRHGRQRRFPVTRSELQTCGHRREGVV